MCTLHFPLELNNPCVPKNGYSVKVVSGNNLSTDLRLLLQEGFAPPDDEAIDEGAQGDQEDS